MCLSIHLADNFLVHPKKMQDGMDAGALRTELERLTGARRQNETELGIITAKKAKQMVIILATDKKKKKTSASISKTGKTLPKENKSRTGRQTTETAHYCINSQ